LVTALGQQAQSFREADIPREAVVRGCHAIAVDALVTRLDRSLGCNKRRYAFDTKGPKDLRLDRHAADAILVENLFRSN
jgi:hypothetical protein